MSEQTSQETETEPDYKQVRLGPKRVRVPSSWQVKEIGNSEVSDKIKAGGTPKASNDDFYGGDIKYVKIEDMTAAGKYLQKTKNHLTKEGLDATSTWLVPEASLLLSMYGSYGKVAITGDEMATNQAILGIIPSDSVDLDYIYYASSRLKPYFESVVLETTQANLNKGIVEKTPLLIPPLPEQRRIANILSTVDKQIQQTETIIEKTRELRRGVLKDLLTEGIHGSQSENTQFGPMELTVPTSWEVVEIDDVVKRLTNGISESQNTNGDGFPVTRIETIADGNVNLSKVGWVDDDPSEYEDYRIRENDILFSHINSLAHVGKAAQYREEEGTLYHGMNLLLLRFDWDLIHPRFAYICITAPYFRKLCRSFAKKAVNQVSLNQGDVGGLPLLLPGYDEQEMIAQRIECIDKRIQLERQQKQQLNGLKQALMQDLLTGKVRVTTDI